VHGLIAVAWLAVSVTAGALVADRTVTRLNELSQLDDDDPTAAQVGNREVLMAVAALAATAILVLAPTIAQAEAIFAGAVLEAALRSEQWSWRQMRLMAIAVAALAAAIHSAL
jgi:hypothetical protein